jgi:PhoD-like phosphatase
VSTLAVHPCASAPGTLRVWLGAFERQCRPALVEWWLDGAPVEPAAVRPLASVRPEEMVREDTPRAFSGVYEFALSGPRRFHTVRVRVDGEHAEFEARPLPESLPTGVDEWFNVLVVSCFHWEEDKVGRIGLELAGLPATLRPDLTLLVGDQVYLDLPTLQDFPDDLHWLAAKFEEDYARNWRLASPRAREGYAAVLGLAPVQCLPDDHEYWNNFPHPSPFIANTHREMGRKRWREAARAAYAGFQHFSSSPLGHPQVLDVGPLSFFFVDTRTERDMNLGHAMPKGGVEMLQAWAERVAASKRFGVFVSGQSLLDAAAQGLDATLGDRTLANYQDYAGTLAALDGLVQRGSDLVCITGDVHWGRVARFEPKGNPGTGEALYEVISSPSSLVTTIGKDALLAARNWLTGSRDAWPRHPHTPDAPATFAPGACRPYEGRTLDRERGNHVTLLSFRSVGTGVELRIHFLVLRPGAGARPSKHTIHLRHR